MNLQVIFRPRHDGHPLARAGMPAGYQSLLRDWLAVFPQSLERDLDFEDWVENAAQLQQLLVLAQRQQRVEIFIDLGQGRSSRSLTPLTTFHSVWDPARPYLLIGPEMRVGDIISPGAVAPSRQEAAAADAYWRNNGFWAHAGRQMSLAAFDDGTGDVPQEACLLRMLAARREAGHEHAIVKVTETKAGVARIALKGASDQSLRDQLLEQLEWTLVRVAGRPNAFLVQDFVQMEHEYRVFVVDGRPVAGAGCIEEHTPLDSRGLPFDLKTRCRRIPPAGELRDKVAEQPAIVDRYREAAPRIAADLMAADARLRTFVLDLCMIDGRVAVVEINAARNAGLYALNVERLIQAMVDSARRQIEEHEGDALQEAAAHVDLPKS